MPRVKTPTERDVILKEMRAFAILKELQNGDADGNISSEALEKVAERLGDKELASKLSEDASFEDFAAAFHKKGEAVEGEGNCLGYAARDDTGKLSPWKFTRRECGDEDVHIKITYAGMCHSDVHTVRGDWGPQKYPLIPGHEIIGVVVETGAKVTKVKVGDYAGVGCMVNSCRNCKQCGKDEEQYCRSGMIGTYGAKDPIDESVTQGGYSTHVMVTQHFVLNLPASLHAPGGAPLLCAGITTYSPMRHYGIDKPGQRIAVVGLGGLGHMAVKLAKAFGQHVTVVSRNDSKKADAMESLGADAFLVSKDEEAMKAAAKTFDGVIDTVSAPHELQDYLNLLDTDGTIVLLGVPPAAYSISPGALIMKRLKVGGSLIGGVKETQEMLDFCAEKKVLSDVELVKADYVNEAIDRMVDGDVKYRFVIDVQGSLIM